MEDTYPRPAMRDAFFKDLAEIFQRDALGRDAESHSSACERGNCRDMRGFAEKRLSVSII